MFVMLHGTAIFSDIEGKLPPLDRNTGLWTPKGCYYAQAFARQIGRHIPGEPHVLVQHVPGAGGLLVANNIYNGAPKDGSVTLMKLGVTPSIGTRPERMAPVCGYSATAKVNDTTDLATTVTLVTRYWNGCAP